MDMLNLLEKGDRKELGQSAKVAQILVADAEAVSELFHLLCKHREHNAIVSHGFYALKEASQKVPRIRKQVIKFCLKHLNRFEQWESKENFLRVCLIEVENRPEVQKAIEPLINDSSAIVQAYASEYLLRFAFLHEPKALKRWNQRIEKIAQKASVKARLRKLRKELKISSTP